jgi:hypothetical protein
MPNHTPEEMELLIKETREEIVKIYEEKPLDKKIREIDKRLILALLDKLESAVVIKFLMQNKCLS